jgi:hypothetical protein
MSKAFSHIDQLSSFDLKVRNHALKAMIESLPPSKEGENINLHIHSFYSYNAEGWSPSRIAWESKITGLFGAGIIDFDNLDGLQEFYETADILGLRASVGIETRTFVEDYRDKEIDSPGEPGVSYVAGAGFTNLPKKGTSEFEFLSFLGQTSKERNIALIERINSSLPELSIDYEKDVLPLTPSGKATERHIIAAYVNKISTQYPVTTDRTTFVASLLKITTDEAAVLLNNRTLFEDKLRSRLAKKGGIGYVQPDSKTFPPVEKMFAWIKACGAIPMESWLDGTSDGEANPGTLLEHSVAMGAAALNIIPDRNWNIKNPEIRALKYAKLKEVVQVAEKMDLPLNIGTEMNKAGLPFVDDLDGKYLLPFKTTFVKGAKIVLGHCLLSRFTGIGYHSEYLPEALQKNKKERNVFFEKIGSLPIMNQKMVDILVNAGQEKAFIAINDALKKGNW